MAPIFAGEIGITPQIIDDERLVQLRDSFRHIPFQVPLGEDYNSSEDVKEPLQIDRLIDIIEPCQTWKFEEQIDLQEWIQPLNRIDACLSYYTQKYPSLLLIGPVERTKSKGAVTSLIQPVSKPAATLEESNAVDQVVIQRLKVLLNFLAALLANSSNKAIFNSVEELVDLLAAADDGVASSALHALCALATPPALHKQQAPEHNHHATALHVSKTQSHNRIITLARGWGTRGLGLGLYTCTTADDSEFGQGSLPKEAGELHFSYVKKKRHEEKKDVVDESESESSMTQITLLREDIVDDAVMHTEPTKIAETTHDDDETSAGKQKRRRVAPILGEETIRSTAELFFRCLDLVGGRKNIPEDSLFALLVEIRLARSFYCRTSRIAAVERRLWALITVLHSNPSQEVVSGYFQAQPELCVELIDLLRPTVSSSSVSAATSKANVGSTVLKQDAISALAIAPVVPYDIRELALQALTALVARRDGSTGALTGVARHSNVLSELGVAKGQYLGLLPTLIRFSLASLGALNEDLHDAKPKAEVETVNADDAIALNLGITFIEAAMPPPLPRTLQLIRALEFVDSVLTLTSAVISTPSGTSSLTEGGLVPALLTTVVVDHEELVNKVVSDASPDELLRIKSLLRFVTAQAVQILEGAIVTHTNALAAFNNLQGVEILIKRLSKAILGSATYEKEKAKDVSEEEMDVDSTENGIDMDETVPSELRCSQRVLLFSIVTCLTVVFHQESTSSSTVAPTGAAQLRTPIVTKAIIKVLDNASVYGGHLISLVATLLCDIMNSDPLVTKHVHTSGIAKSFLYFLPQDPDAEPVLEPVQELIMTVPNVISALALTSDGLEAVKESNPFPALLKLFYHPKYAMPRSRCLLNEMTAIVGTTLDETMRNFTPLKPLICSAIVQAMNNVAMIGQKLHLQEKAAEYAIPEDNKAATDLENARSCLMQYVLNFGQLLEQILHNESHCEIFVSVGGLEAILQLYPHLISTGQEFLAHISCLSCPSVSTLGHSTTEDSMTLAFKCIALRANPFKVIKCLITAFQPHLHKLSEAQLALRRALQESPSVDGLDASFILDGLPRQPLYEINSIAGSYEHEGIVSDYLRQVAVIQWLCGLLASSIKAACQNSFETGTGWSQQEKEWKTELSSTEFEVLLSRLSAFARTAILDVCRVRTESGFERTERERLNGKPKNLRYRLRIVCPEGAVVRDGIEIDSCDNVGSMEMSEIVDAFDRCVNTSGVLRYRTKRGWVSEQTRGHGREPIAEVLGVWISKDEQISEKTQSGSKKRVESSVPDLRTSCANVLARVQANYVELLSGLSRLAFQSIRSIPVRTISFEEGTIASHVSTVISILTKEISESLNHSMVVQGIDHGSVSTQISKDGIAMYFGCLLSTVKQCLFDEKRDRRTVYVPLLVRLCLSEELDKGETKNLSIFDAIKFISTQAASNFKKLCVDSVELEIGNPVGRRRVDRPTAASLPTAIAILKRFISSSSITSSPASSVLSRVQLQDFAQLLGKADSQDELVDLFANEKSFSPEKFARMLLCKVSESVSSLWINEKLVFAPPHILHPVAMLVGEVIVGLEEATKKKTALVSRRTRPSSDLLNAFRGLVGSHSSNSSRQALEEFEPSEDAINRMMEMGFSREHAWDALDSTRTNRIEAAMEYALAHAPPSSDEIRRRQAARAERRRRREQESATNNAENEENTNDNENEENGGEANEATRTDGSGAGESNGRVSNSNENMDVDADSEKKITEKDSTIARALSYVEEWKVKAVKGSCDILGGVRGMETLLKGSKTSAGDIEALTVVLSSFLIDLFQVYPDQRENISNELFDRLEEQISISMTEKKTEAFIPVENELPFSVFCHASLLFIRALPRTRKLLLQKSLVSRIILCIQNAMKQKTPREPNQAPRWLASALLLLDVMAQPVIAFTAKDEDNSSSMGESDRTDLLEVQQDHEKLNDEMSRLAFALSAQSFPAEAKVEDTVNSSRHQDDDHNNLDEEEGEVAKSETKRQIFKNVPPFFPLIPISLTTKCLDICIQILDSEWKSAGIVQGVLLLLMRLLRSPTMATYGMKSGLVEKIIGLPRESRFTGHTGIVTLVLRRLLEDEPVLQGAMEIEIRGTMMKLYNKSKKGTADAGETPRVGRKAFIQAVVPLLCREPISFLKAMFVTVRLLIQKDEATEGYFSLLSSQERLRNVKILSEILRKASKGASVKFSQPRRSSLGKSRKSLSTPRSKTPARNSKRGPTHKRSKKERQEQNNRSEEEVKNSSAGFVINLLIQSVVSESEPASTDKENFDFGFEKGMLWAADFLDVIADLVLAIPACAAAIHRFRPSKGRLSNNSALCSPMHAILGGQSPPKTFVSFVLHSILVTAKRETNAGVIMDTLEEDERKMEMKRIDTISARKTKVSQSAARLLVALVARPGEGRKQVIGELAFALSAGKLGLTSTSTQVPQNKVLYQPENLSALQVWAELCIGLAAPRSSGGGNYEGNSFLSFDVIRIMLDIGMAHALLLAMHMVPLNHPRTSATLSALLVPFEVFSRPTVGDALKALQEKLSSSRNGKAGSKPEKPFTKGLSRVRTEESTNTRDSFADDHMLEEAFALDSSRDDHAAGFDERYEEGDEGPGFVVAEEDPDMEEVVGEDDDEMEIDGDDIDDNEESDDGMSSSGSSDVSSDDGDDDDDDDVSGDEEDDDDEEEESSIIEDEDGDTYAENNLAQYDVEPIDNQIFDEAQEEPSAENGQRTLEEGWTRIEATGFGGTVLGSRRGMSGTVRTRGFIDAAEAMIGTLLRSGDLQNDALAEIEGSLGIRIMPHGTRTTLTVGNRSEGHADSLFSNASRNQTSRERFGTLPHVHQRSQPDVGYSALGGGGRWSEINSMEYIFGGPSITAGNRNYDLVPRETEEEDGLFQSDTSPDAPLFPGGPASGAHARAQHSMHPLLCGIDLPPQNALVSDMLPHESRATRRGQMVTRRPGDWTNGSLNIAGGGFLVATANGNIVRSNRGSSSGSLTLNAQARQGSGPIGWTDDGFPFDSTVEEFTAAFEEAFVDSCQVMVEEDATEHPEESMEALGQESAEAGMETDGEEHVPQDTAMQESSVETENNTLTAQQESSVGDAVASSLAEGLRLSPQEQGEITETVAENINMQAVEELRTEEQQVENSSQDNAEGDENPDAEDGIEHADDHHQNVDDNNDDVGTAEEPSADSNVVGGEQESSSNGLACPEGMDPEVFSVLPPEMQQEVIEQARTAADVAAQLDAESSLDPEALAALPEDMRREVIEQEQRERRTQAQAPANPANAEEMDNASFVASLSPELRREILMTADDSFLQSLPPDIIAEAQLLRERASTTRRVFEAPTNDSSNGTGTSDRAEEEQNHGAEASTRENSANVAPNVRRKLQRAYGKIRVDKDRDVVVQLSKNSLPMLSSPIASSDFKTLLLFMYLLSPIRPHKVLQNVFQNMSCQPNLRKVVISAFIKLLHDDNKGAIAAIQSLVHEYTGMNDWRQIIDQLVEEESEDFPPPFLIGPAPQELKSEGPQSNINLIRKKQSADTVASMAANLPIAARGSRHERYLPPVVAARIVDVLQTVTKNSPRFFFFFLTSGVDLDQEGKDTGSSGFEKLLDLLEKPRYSKSSENLEQLLLLLESAVSPLSYLPKNGEEDAELSQKDLDAALQAGKEWVDVPRIVVCQQRLQLLCSVLRMETCRDLSLTRVNTIARRLCRVEANRGYVLAELASVARALGVDAMRDLKTLAVRMSDAVSDKMAANLSLDEKRDRDSPLEIGSLISSRSTTSSVAVSSSTSELKLLRVLQTLQALCADLSEDASARKNDGQFFVTEELVRLLQAMELDGLWTELTSCLKVVQILEGVEIEKDDSDTADGDGHDGDDESGDKGKKLQNSVAGLLTRFLPTIEAFFVANASATRGPDKESKGTDSEFGKEESAVDNMVGGHQLVNFVEANKVLLNALIRNNSGLLDRGLRALIQVPRCRHLLDFDVKRHWFKAQVRRLRQQANRRYGSLRLHIRRRNVFEDAYHQLRLRNADEMRGRLHITFRDEQGVDAGGLSREFFGILAKEIFNPNYALFTSTEDGSTFQPNPHSSINPDHLSYFRFVGRIVGKAVSDGYLLDAHFTRSLYKHMLGIKPTHHDMEAIDPDYYKNLKTILEYNLGDLGLDLTFSIEDHSFGRNRLIDLIPNGRNEAVTETNKAKYVSLVCQHRMTTAISSQIKAYLDGFYELVSRDLVAVFTPRELELLISGLPDIDVHDLKLNTDYVGWKASDQQIQWFWNVLFSLTRNQKAAFLQFVTGSSKVPLAGFGELPGMRGVQKFSIHKVVGTAGSLMSAHTCFNSLDLPPYRSEEELKEKLLYAITEGAGTFMIA